jgi:hypothetical protein
LHGLRNDEAADGKEPLGGSLLRGRLAQVHWVTGSFPRRKKEMPTG